MVSSASPSLAECVPPHVERAACSRSSSEFSLLGEDSEEEQLHSGPAAVQGSDLLRALVEEGAPGVFRWISSGGPSQVRRGGPSQVRRERDCEGVCVCVCVCVRV